MAESHCFNEVVSNRPLDPDRFESLVPKKLSVLIDARDNYLTVAYDSTRDDRVDFLQACLMNGSDSEFHVELGIIPESGRPFSLYEKDNVSLEEAVSLFHAVFVDYKAPNLNEWKEATNDHMYYQHAMEIVDKYRRIDNPTEDDEFQYVEALTYLIGVNSKKKKEYLNDLAWFYAERREFDLERKYLQMAADLGDGNAMCELGYMWYYGQHGEVNYEKAYYCFKDGLKGDDEVSRLYCKYKIADMYRYGLFVEKDEEKYRDLVFEALEEIGRPKHLGYPYAEVAYRAAGIEASEGNTPRAVYLLLEAKRFLAERLRLNNYWGHIDIMIRIVKALYELTDFPEEDISFYDLICLAEHGGRARLQYRGSWHIMEVSDKNDGGICFDGKWFESMGTFLEKCTLDNSKVTSIYDEFSRLEVVA